MHFQIFFVKYTYTNPNDFFVFFKGVLHPWPVFWLFMHFSQKLQHIGDK